MIRRSGRTQVKLLLPVRPDNHKPLAAARALARAQGGDVQHEDDAAGYLEQHANRVALLLTDITMPGTLNGADLANQFGDRWPEKPIMIMSGYETPESSGVRHDVSFIKKPWALGQMLDCVEGALKSGPVRR
mgnify:CR=1 FL=1